MLNGNGYTPTQRRILEVLKDGRLHRREELEACLNDNLATPVTLRVHLTYLRGKIRRKGLDIFCRGGAVRASYQLVKLLATDLYGE